MMGLTSTAISPLELYPHLRQQHYYSHGTTAEVPANCDKSPHPSPPFKHPHCALCCETPLPPTARKREPFEADQLVNRPVGIGPCTSSNDWSNALGTGRTDRPEARPETTKATVGWPLSLGWVGLVRALPNSPTQSFEVLDPAELFSSPSLRDSSRPRYRLWSAR